jgi:hypothetical protein
LGIPLFFFVLYCQINVKEAFDVLVREVRKEQKRPSVAADSKPCCAVS